MCTGNKQRNKKCCPSFSYFDANIHSYNTLRPPIISTWHLTRPFWCCYFLHFTHKEMNPIYLKYYLVSKEQYLGILKQVKFGSDVLWLALDITPWKDWKSRYVGTILVVISNFFDFSKLPYLPVVHSRDIQCLKYLVQGSLPGEY